MKLFALVGVANSVQHGASEASNPVRSVVGFLETLRTEAERDEKVEQQLYDKFVCWGENVITTKKTSNEVASRRIDDLEAHISDIDAGRIDFPNEQADMEKDVEESIDSIDAAESLRRKEHGDFLAAEDEMSKASAALDEAIMVLKEATSRHEAGVLIQVSRTGVSSSEGFAVRKEKGALLGRVSDLGHRILSKGDAVFLQTLLSGEVPKPNWKKVHRKSNVLAASKARTLKIQDILAKMKLTVDVSLQEARAKEEDAVALFEKLMRSKREEKQASQDALLKVHGYSSAREAAKEEARNELDALRSQVRNDEMFIAETHKSLEEKEEEWRARSTFRAGEIAAVSKALFILNNDDAKDLMKRAFDSRGVQLVQVKSGTSRHAKAAGAIRRAAKATGNLRLVSLASLLSSYKGSHLTEYDYNDVFHAIDNMISTLKAEERTDLKTKETCEDDRHANTGIAARKSRDMDEITDDIKTRTDRIASLQVEIVENKETIKSTQEEIDSATQRRREESVAFMRTNADNKLAKETVEKAKAVLNDYYQENLALVQMQVRHQNTGSMASRQELGVGPGETPAPPPPTFDEPYAGKTDEGTSIFVTLDMIISDLEKNMKAARAAEDEAQQEFEHFKMKSEQQISDLSSDIAAREGDQGKEENAISEDKTQRTAASAQVNAVMKAINQERPGCDFFEVNYPNRLKNRQIEIDGLQKAKAILHGADFGGGFLQRRFE